MNGNNPDDPYITESRLNAILDEKFKRFGDEILEVIRDFAARVDERFNRIEERLDRIELSVQIHDDQLRRHERWHYQIANKLHTKLDSTDSA